MSAQRRKTKKSRITVHHILHWLAVFAVMLVGLIAMAAAAVTGKSFALGLGAFLCFVQWGSLHLHVKARDRASGYIIAVVSLILFGFLAWMFPSVTMHSVLAVAIVLLTTLLVTSHKIHVMTPIRDEASMQRQEFGGDAGIRYLGRNQSITLDDIYGMVDTKSRLKRAAVEITEGEAGARNGILMYGEPGNGKTVFAKALAGELDLPLITITHGDIASKYINESTENLMQVFRDAKAQAPCVLFLDEVDSLMKSRENSLSTNQEAGQIVNTLLTEMINLRSHRVVLMAATNYLAQLDAAAIREGRFDYKIEITPPDKDARIGILSSALVDRFPSNAIDDEGMVRAAVRWEGFSVKRIQSVAEELADMRKESAIAKVDFDTLQVALRRVQGKRGSLPANTKTVDQLILTDSVRKQIRGIARRMKDVDLVERRGGTVPAGLLFFGPQGTGKTECARALAKHSGWAFLATSGNDLISNSQELDRLVKEAKDIRPCIIFIDEADDVLQNREMSGVTTVTNKLLTVMDGAAGKTPDILFIAATNHPDRVDPAALRGGRFTEKVSFQLPDHAGLTSFIAAWLDSSKASFEGGLDAHTLAVILGEVSIANAQAVLQEAVNQMIGRTDEGGDFTVTQADVQSAKQAVLALA